MKGFFPSSFFPPRAAFPPALLTGIIAIVVVTTHRVFVGDGGLVLDDAIHLAQLPALNAGRSLPELLVLPHWQEHPGDILWRPMAKVLWAQLGPESPLLPTVTTLLAGLVAALFAWFLLARCSIPPSIAIPAGLLPVCHPLAADVLLPYVGQMDLLAAAGMLGALALMSQRSQTVALVGAGCFALALLSKESALPALIALPLAVAAVSPGRTEAIRRAGRALILLLGVAAAWFAVRAWLFAGAEGALGTGGGWYREGERRLSSLEILGRYFAALLDPRTPQTDYSFLKQPGSSAGIFPVVGVLGLAGIVGAAWFLFWGGGKGGGIDDRDSQISRLLQGQFRMVAAMVWIVVFLLPYLQIIPIGALWAGRFAFLSLFGFAWLVAELIALIPARPRLIATCALITLLLVGAIQVNRRAPDFSDAVTLWTSEVQRRPDHAFAWNNFGIALQYADDPTAGLEAVRHATDLFPTYGEAWLSRGRIERALGDHAAGRASYMRAEALMGDDLDLQMEIARLDASEGYFGVALARLEALAGKGAGNAEYEELIERVRQDLETLPPESGNQE